MRFLLVGHGAREHAIARRLVHDGHEAVACATQRNPGLSEACQALIEIRSYSQPKPIIRAAIDAKAGMILPCDEESLFAGIADAADEHSIPCLGHGAKASVLLERKRDAVISSMKAVSPARSPRGLVATRTSDLKNAKHLGDKIVVKPLHANKGGKYAIVFGGIEGQFHENLFPAWVEPDEPGEDFSLHYLVSGERFYFLGVTLDYPMLDKSSRIVTGGMGAIALPEACNTPIADALIQKCRQMTEAGLRAMQREHEVEFRGFISAQFRKVRRGAIFTEFDCKPGNPEFQALLPLIQGDIGGLFHAAFNGEAFKPERSQGFSVAISLVPPGYPDKLHRRRLPRDLPISANDILVGGVIEDAANKLWVDGARSLCVVSESAKAATAIALASDRAAELAAISGLEFCQDIGANLRANAATARVKTSIENLKIQGGKRLMLRLTPSALAAVKKIMIREGYKTQTAAINETLIQSAKSKHA